MGHVDIELLKSLLPFDDHEFYFCGPPPFMESLYNGLKSLHVADDRIHYEFFGPGTTLLQKFSPGSESLTEALGDRQPVEVRFTRSGIETLWDPSKGTLLDLAESEGLQPAYSCRSGICQTCSTGVVSGNVDYLESPMTEPAENQALICCSYPRSEPVGDENAARLILDL